nr:hypothetical protein [Acidimicrobiia bacterium]
LLIIGSSNSSNTLALEKVAREMGCERVYRIDSASQLGNLNLKENDIVGVTAGASAPEDIVQEVVSACNASEGVHPLSVINEDEYFPPPSQLRDLALDLNFAIDAIFAARHRDESLSPPRTAQDLRTVFSHDRTTLAADTLIAS